jgi:hypothetical protein
MKASWQRRLLLVLSGACLLRSERAPACQCGQKPSTEEALAQAQVVVAGVVTAIKQVPVTYTGVAGPHSDTLRRFTVKVQKRWKGSAESELYVFEVSNCAYQFTVGHAYLVFASPAFGTAAPLEATICLPNKPYGKASPELAVLGPPAAAP